MPPKAGLPDDGREDGDELVGFLPKTFQALREGAASSDSRGGLFAGDGELGGIPEQFLQSELRGVIKRLPGDMAQTIGIEQREIGSLLLKPYLFKHSGLGVLKQAVNTPQDKHGHDDFSVFAPNKDIPQAIVSNGSDERDDLVVGEMIQATRSFHRERSLMTEL